MAAVADGEQHVGARPEGHVRVALREVAVELDGLDRDGDGAAGGRGVAGVEDQVDDDLVELGAVGVDRRQVVVHLERERVVGAERLLQQGGEVADDVAQAERLGLRVLLPAEGEELLGDPRGAAGGLDHLLQVARGRVIRVEAAEGHVAEAEHRGHHVVDLVGHAAGQLAHGLDPLAPADLLLVPGALGQVVADLELAGAGPERGADGAEQGDRLHRALEQGDVPGVADLAERGRLGGRAGAR